MMKNFIAAAALFALLCPGVSAYPSQCSLANYCKNHLQAGHTLCVKCTATSCNAYDRKVHPWKTTHDRIESGGTVYNTACEDEGYHHV